MNIPTWLSTAAATISTVLLAACDVAVQEIQPGVSTATEVKARMGEPGFLHTNSDGTVTWEYSRQPSGVHCYMITMGSNQIVEKLEQVLIEANYARVHEGMAREEVRRLLGAPGSKVVFENLHEDIWEWRIEGMPPTDETFFMVHFDLNTGGVKKTSKRVAMKG